MNSIVTFFQNFFSSIPRWIAMGLGIVWAWMEPTLPYALMCVFAVIVDCLTAWRLNRRIRRTVPEGGADGKLKSAHMFKMISDLAVVWLCILLAQGVDHHLLGHFGGLHLGQYIAAIFVLCTFVSILENESSCNSSTWARVVQKIVCSKVERHIDMRPGELEEILKGKEAEKKPRRPRKPKAPMPPMEPPMDMG